MKRALIPAVCLCMCGVVLAQSTAPVTPDTDAVAAVTQLRQGRGLPECNRKA